MVPFPGKNVRFRSGISTGACILQRVATDIDRVDLGNGLVINKQSIGVAQKQQSFGNGIDGILGVGPTDLTRGAYFSFLLLR